MKKQKNGARLSQEELKKCLGACHECGWKRGQPRVEVTGPDWNQHTVVRILCKAVSNGASLTRPKPQLQNADDCPHRKRAIEKQRRNAEYATTKGRVSNITMQHSFAVG